MYGTVENGDQGTLGEGWDGGRGQEVGKEGREREER